MFGYDELKECLQYNTQFGRVIMVKGIDCAVPLTAKTAAAIKMAGYDFAGRYLVPAVGSLAQKALTAAEAKTVTDMGLRLLTVWETTADRVKGAAAGASDGKRALQCAREIGMPGSGIIYFAVDYDAAAADMPVIEAYLRAARAQTGDYEIGVYGSYSVIEYMAQRNVCRGYWQSEGWSDGKVSAYRSVYQAQRGQVVAGVPVDINECPDMARAGIWNYEEEETVKRYNTLAEMPDWARETIKKLVDKDYLVGNGEGLNLSEDMIRLLVVLDRAGAFGA